ncbi:MAG: DUF6056 family protein, partial [Brevinema sp.]
MPFSGLQNKIALKAVIFYIFIFCAILTMNLLQLPMADEWAQWPHSLQGSGFKYAISTYYTWNSRIGEILFRLFLVYFSHDIFQHQIIFGIINTVVFSIFVTNLFIIIKNRFPHCEKQDVSLVAFIFMAIYLSSSFNQSFIWSSGALNYGWALFLISFWALPYARLLHNSDMLYVPTTIQSYFSFKEISKALIFFIVAVPVGMGGEILTPTALFMVALIFFYYLFIRRAFPPLWFITGALGLFIGWLALILAPGPAMRKAVVLSMNPHAFDRTPKVIVTRIMDNITSQSTLFSGIYYLSYLISTVSNIRNKKYQLMPMDWLILGLGATGAFGLLIAAIGTRIPLRTVITYTIFWA